VTDALRAGDRVHHPQKGNCTVLASDAGIISARFDDGETRSFLAAHPGVRRLASSEEGRISPAWAEIDDPGRFIPPLTAGERRLARFLDSVLPPDWNLYVRPHLDADRPLIAALHPTAGGMFWDVVDWDLSGFRVDRGIWVGEGLIEGRFASPFRFLNEVRSRVYGVYAPEIGEAINDDTRRFGVLRAGLFFANASTADARRLAAQDPAAGNLDAFGREGLDVGDPRRVIPILGRGRVLEDTWFETLDRAFTHERRIPDPLSLITLNKEQRPFAVPNDGYTALEGVAGSGKTIVLAHRAAVSAEAERRALILTFNRTLTNYVRGMLGLVPVVYRRDRVTILHLHELCRRIHDHYRVPLPPLGVIRRAGGSSTSEEEAADQQVLEAGWPASAMRLLEQRGVPDVLRFDAVLIDEAQDFSPPWFALVRKLGAMEVVLAYDAAQRLYAREAAMARGEIARLFGGKTGRVHRLGKAIRLPATTIRLATAFAGEWALQTLALEIADEGLLPLDAKVTTINVMRPADAAAAVLGVLRTWQVDPNYRARDVAVIVPDKSLGEALVRLLAEHGVSTNHVFAVSSTGALMEAPIADADAPPWRIAQAHKTAFAFGDVRLKVSTVHSFKGWEAGRVIFILPFKTAPRNAAGLVYVGLTRSRGDLVLVGRISDYRIDNVDGVVALPMDLEREVVSRFDELLSEAGSSSVTRRRANTTASVDAEGGLGLWPDGWADSEPDRN
jgi:hypothetical protein